MNELDNVANDAHNEETDADGLGDLDKLPLLLVSIRTMNWEEGRTLSGLVQRFTN